MRKQFLGVMMLCGALLVGCQGQEMTEEKYNNMSIEEQIQYNAEQEALVIGAIMDAESVKNVFKIVSYDYSYDEVIIHATVEYISLDELKEDAICINQEGLTRLKASTIKITEYFEDRGINNVHVIIDVKAVGTPHGYYDLENGWIHEFWCK